MQLLCHTIQFIYIYIHISTIDPLYILETCHLTPPFCRDSPPFDWACDAGVDRHQGAHLQRAPWRIIWERMEKVSKVCVQMIFVYIYIHTIFITVIIFNIILLVLLLYIGISYVYIHVYRFIFVNLFICLSIFVLICYLFTCLSC